MPSDGKEKGALGFRMKKLLFLICILAISIIVFSLSCSSSNNNSGTTGTSSNIHEQGIVLITGPPDKEVVWHITNVAHVYGYMTKDKYVKGDGMTINGYCTTENGETPFFDHEKPMFIVEDNNGQLYEIGVASGGSDVSEKEDSNGGKIDYFMIQVGLAGEGMTNPSIKSWSDLNLADPNIETQKLPGHKVSLGAFNKQT